MTVKKEYKVGDTVWIYGIDSLQNKSRKGTVIKSFFIDNFTDEHYVISVPTEIEDLLEIRTWHTISQDENGPVGSIRETVTDLYPTKKFLSRVGFNLVSDMPLADEDEPTPEQIHAAIERSKKAGEHNPLYAKESKPKRRYFKKKKV